MVVAWCGMRGIVTLATALALPMARGDVPAFPYRDLVIAAAFAVVLGTLVRPGDHPGAADAVAAARG